MREVLGRHPGEMEKPLKRLDVLFVPGTPR